MYDKVSIKRIKERIDKENFGFITLQTIDLNGFSRGETMPIGNFLELVDSGKWFDGSSITGFKNIALSDQFLKPDLDTFTPLPWLESPKKKKLASVICDVYEPNKKPFVGDPRYILKKALRAAERQGLHFNTASELEFYIYQEEGGVVTPHDTGGYYEITGDKAAYIKLDIMETLAEMDLEVEMAHHEVGPGQHEIGVKYAGALEAADQIVRQRMCYKGVAREHGVRITCMPKFLKGHNGSGLHTNFSLADPEGKNLFYSEEDKKFGYNLSRKGEQFTAGVFNHINGLTGILNFSVNSFKRLIRGYEAPIYVVWGQGNRSTLMRIPRIFGSGAQRVELRSPDPSCNIYLAYAGILAAGLDGIKKKSTLPNPVEEKSVYEFTDKEMNLYNAKPLPGSLPEAIDALQKDKVICRAIGKHTLDAIVKEKAKEYNAYREDYLLAVSPWEIKRYLEQV